MPFMWQVIQGVARVNITMPLALADLCLWHYGYIRLEEYPGMMLRHGPAHQAILRQALAEMGKEG